MSATPTPLTSKEWGRLAAQLTTFAWRNTRRRSWELAQEIAQQAITEYLARPAAWDPSKKTLLRHLGHEVLRLARNELRRSRNQFEVAMDYVDLVENEVANDDESADEVLDGRRIAKLFHDRLVARLAGDDVAMVVVTLMMEEIETPLAQEKASGLSLATLKDARRRVFYQADQVAKELAAELGEAGGAFARAVSSKLTREMQS